MIDFFNFLVDVFDEHDWVVTIVVGFIAVVLYYQRRAHNKSDAAKLILQEMRYADQKVRNYRTYDSYNFAEKILPTNSWDININFFIRDLTESELDLISKFFSSASYLDEVVKAISDNQRDGVINPKTPYINDNEPIPIATSTGSLSGNGSTKKLIDSFSKDIESIYNTPAADKLRKISQRKVFVFFGV